MKHYYFFKFGRIYFEKIYELYGDIETAKDFQIALSKQYETNIILMEVI